MKPFLQGALTLMLLVLPFGAFAQDSPTPQQIPFGETLTDPIALLQERLDAGVLKLQPTPEHGYLESVLGALSIPRSSQALIFSKTSLERDIISARTPRALYFNDDVYVAWIPRSPMLEIASTDPKYGTVFYTLAQSTDQPLEFQRLEPPCTSCHAPARNEVPAPLLLMLSVKTDEVGDPNDAAFHLTTDRSPIAERWGGWYVTGDSGGVAHQGRPISFDTTPYLTPQSDLVALSVLAHQVDVHNRISEASHAVRQLSDGEDLKEAVEPLVRTLLFSDAAGFTAPIRGSTGFAAEFAARGPKDSQGRSLRDLDLQTRLFRYPLSYLIYSDSFRQMPERARRYVYTRLREVLTGQDRTGDFGHLTPADRTAILEILSATLPEFREGAN